MKNTHKTNKNLWSVGIFFLLGILLASGVLIGVVFPMIREGSSSSSSRSLVLQTNDAANKTACNVTIDNTTATRSMPIVAVDSYGGDGVTGHVVVRMIPGSANVLVDTHPFIETDLQYSMNTAVDVAKRIASNDAPNSDIVLSYEMPSTNAVGGGSAGAATTIAVIAALENKTINPDALMTGTIEPDGSIGQVGGVLEKAKAAAAAGYKVFVVPEGQSQVVTYKKVVNNRQLANGGIYSRVSYVPEVVNLQDELNGSIQIKEVSTIQDAEKIFFR